MMNNEMDINPGDYVRHNATGQIHKVLAIVKEKSLLFLEGYPEITWSLRDVTKIQKVNQLVEGRFDRADLALKEIQLRNLIDISIDDNDLDSFIKYTGELKSYLNQ